MAADRQGTDDQYPPLPWRRRILVLLLAVLTAATIVLMLIYRPGDPKHDALQAARAKPAPAIADAASGVGGRAQVMLLPSGAASR